MLTTCDDTALYREMALPWSGELKVFLDAVNIALLDIELARPECSLNATVCADDM